MYCVCMQENLQHRAMHKDGGPTHTNEKEAAVSGRRNLNTQCFDAVIMYTTSFTLWHKTEALVSVFILLPFSTTLIIGLSSTFNDHLLQQRHYDAQHRGRPQLARRHSLRRPLCSSELSYMTSCTPTAYSRSGCGAISAACRPRAALIIPNGALPVA